MIAAKKTNVDGKFAQAVLLQSYAVKLYKEKKEAQAACASLQGRQLAFDIMNAISEKKRSKAIASDEEKKLATSCSTEEAMLKESKKAMKNISEKDEDYKDPRTLNNTNIDL